MSKERVLLERVKAEGYISFGLYKEIEELLAQPAPITFKDDADKIAHLENSVELLSSLLDASKSEPLSLEGHTIGEKMMSKEREMLQRIVDYADAYLEIDIEFVDPIKELLSQPEQTEQKPLTPQQISVGNQSMLNVTRDAFVKGVKFAEQQHGIGE